MRWKRSTLHRSTPFATPDVVLSVSSHVSLGEKDSKAMGLSGRQSILGSPWLNATGVSRSLLDASASKIEYACAGRASTFVLAWVQVVPAVQPELAEPCCVIFNWLAETSDMGFSRPPRHQMRLSIQTSCQKCYKTFIQMIRLTVSQPASIRLCCHQKHNHPVLKFPARVAFKNLTGNSAPRSIKKCLQNC
jgi:hypothetical protein